MFKLLIALLLMLFTSPLGAESSQVRIISLNGPISPVSADYVQRNLREAALKGDKLLVIEMDTPGGLDSAMRAIVKEIFASSVPVAVHVMSAGARAASAGAVITLAADIAVMAPGTNIGAAHPVSIGEKPDAIMQKKLANDAEAYVEGIAAKRGRNMELAKKMVSESLSLPAEKALAGGLIDLLAASRSELLEKLDGRRLQRDGREVVLSLKGAIVKESAMTARERVLAAISNPNVAYVLLMIGLLGLFFELSNPGVILPGAIGGIALLLACFAFQTLPVNYAGVLLIILAIILFIAEIKIVSHGMLTVGGVVAMVFGSLLLFESPEPAYRVSWEVILVTVLAAVLFSVVAVSKSVKAHRQKPVTGSEGLLGEEGLVESELAPEGKVFVRGEYWNARSDQAISAGEKVEVVAVEGMLLKVKRKT